MSSFTSQSDPKWIYDVFLSFRGADARASFVSHLHASLSNAGINTFMDDANLQRGEDITVDLVRAIEGSQISIVVFSPNYASSRWCLNELVKIMECRRNIGQLVIPVFYKVDPADVRHQRGSFAEAFEKHRQRTEDPHWRPALVEAASLSGLHLKNGGNESDEIEKIVDVIWQQVDKTYLHIADFPVGVEPRVQHVIHFLGNKSERACMIGILGMGGVGKTTIAKAIYNALRRNFRDKSFLLNIREVWEKDKGQTDLQEQLLWDILKRRDIKIHSIEWGKSTIKERLLGKKALVVLDDVNKFEQLNALCANHEWNAPGTVIIITTRDARLLNVLKVDYVYRVKEMDENESFELFSWHAFKKESPREDFIELSRHVVAYCGGLPLAIEVLGSYLYERTKEDWKSVLSKLERIPNNQVHEKLKISFDV